MKLREYAPPGPVAAAFIADKTSFVRGIMGPQGSGKTSAVIADIIENAGLMPTCLDGIKRCRHLVVRDTYLNLQKSFLASWFEWFDKDASFTGGGDRPAMHSLRFDVIERGKRVPLELEMHFVAIGEHRAEDVLRGFQITSATLNEADLLAPDVLDYLIGRTGRWPAMRMLLTAQEMAAIEQRLGRPPETAADLPPHVRYRDYITCDFNAPDTDNWAYQRFVEERPANFAFYRQPSGLSPAAENKRNLKPGYYQQQKVANAHRPWWVRRMIDNEFGFSRDGLPVYPEFNDQVHCAGEPLELIANVPVRIGLDAGGHPAAVIGQWLADGQWRIVQELAPGRIGPTRFAELLRNWLQQAGSPIVASAHVDPTAFEGADKEGGELSWAETVARVTGLQIDPAPSNEPTLRQDAVREALRWSIDGHKAGFVLSSTCKILRKGFASHYRYQRQRVGNTETFADRPQKNDWSHPHDALQYLMLGSQGREAVINGRHAPPDEEQDGNVVVAARFDLFAA